MKYFATFDADGNRIATYVDDIHMYIPKNAIEITEDEQNLYTTNEYVRDMTTGKPIKKQPKVPSNDELLAVIRLQRNELLSESDWTQMPDVDLTEEQKQSWKVYRQALRDMPETCDPTNPIYPVKPKLDIK